MLSRGCVYVLLLTVVVLRAMWWGVGANRTVCSVSSLLTLVMKSHGVGSTHSLVADSIEQSSCRCLVSVSLTEVQSGPWNWLASASQPQRCRDASASGFKADGLLGLMYVCFCTCPRYHYNPEYCSNGMSGLC